MEILVNFDKFVGKFMENGEKQYRAYFEKWAKFSNRHFRTYTAAKEYHDRVVSVCDRLTATIRAKEAAETQRLKELTGAIQPS